jgi:hypothetical protein
MALLHREDIVSVSTLLTAEIHLRVCGGHRELEEASRPVAVPAGTSRGTW